MKLRKNQSGFAVVELLLVLVFLAIVAFAGYYVYHTQKDSNKKGSTNNSAANTEQMTLGTIEKAAGGKVQITLPKGWSETSRVDGGQTCGFAAEDPAVGTCLTDIGFGFKGNTTNTNGYMKVFQTGMTVKNWHNLAIGTDLCTSPVFKTLHGNSELICTTNPDGGKDYTISNGKYIVYFAGDESQNFGTIVGSVKFL